MANNQLNGWIIAALVAILLIPIGMWMAGAGMRGGMSGMMNGGMGAMMAFGWIWMIVVPVAMVLLIVLFIRGVSRT